MTKLLTAAAVMATLALAACTSTGTGVSPSIGTGNAVGTATSMGMNIFKASIDARCRSELEQQNAWRLVRVAMTPQQEETAKTKICGCVSEQAPQQITVVDMTNAAIDPNYRKQLVVKVVAKSLQSCYASLKP